MGHGRRKAALKSARKSSQAFGDGMHAGELEAFALGVGEATMARVMREPQLATDFLQVSRRAPEGRAAAIDRPAEPGASGCSAALLTCRRERCAPWDTLASEGHASLCHLG